MQDDATIENLVKRPKTWRTLAIVTVLIFSTAIALVAVTFFVNWWRARAALDAEIAAIVARGEPVWFRDLQPDPNDPALERGRLLMAAIEKLPEFPAEFPRFTLRSVSRRQDFR